MTQVDRSLPLQPNQHSTLSLGFDSDTQSAEGGSEDDFLGDVRSNVSTSGSSFNLYDDDDQSDLPRAPQRSDDVKEMVLEGKLSASRSRVPVGRGARALPRLHVEIERGDVKREEEQDDGEESSSTSTSSRHASLGSSISKGSDRSSGTRSRQSSIQSQPRHNEERSSAPLAARDTASLQLAQHVVTLKQRMTRLKQLLQQITSDAEYDADFDAEDEAHIVTEIEATEQQLQAALRKVPADKKMKFKLECTIKRRELLLEQAVATNKLDPEQDERLFAFFVKKQVKLMELLQ